jgi:hypothetical protein
VVSEEVELNILFKGIISWHDMPCGLGEGGLVNAAATIFRAKENVKQVLT